MSRNVVVTGMGVVAPSGNTVGAFWSALEAGRCAIGPHTFKSTEELWFTVPAAPVVDLDDKIKSIGQMSGRMDRFTQLAMIAADEAMSDSGLKVGDELAPRAAIIIGLSLIHISEPTRPY